MMIEARIREGRTGKADEAANRCLLNQLTYWQERAGVSF